MTTLAYHGADRMDFGRFDLAAAGVYNIGLHFGTKAAAESRIAFLQEKNPSAGCRILTCELTLKNPLRVEDIFGFSYGRIIEVLEAEIRRALPAAAPLKRKFDLLSRRWMNADDNPRFAKNPSLYFAFNQKLNVELRRLFQKLGYDGFYYKESPLLELGSKKYHLSNQFFPESREAVLKWIYAHGLKKKDLIVIIESRLASKS